MNSQAILGEGNYKYEIVENWEILPDKSEPELEPK